MSRWLLLVHLLAKATVVALEADGKVHDLTTSSFDGALKGSSLAFVEFYAPWCGHCKKLVPEWEKVAELANSVLVAKVDAVAEKKLAEKHGVQGFPTLKLFRGGSAVSKLYQGERTADKMAAWLEVWKRGPLLDTSISQDGTTHTAASLRAWSARAKTIALLGIRSGDEAADATMLDVLTDAAFVLNPQKPVGDIPVAVASVESTLLAELGVPLDAASKPGTPFVVAFRNFDLEDKFAIYQPGGGWRKQTYDKFMSWVESKRMPSLIPARKDTEQFFLQGSSIDTGNGLVILFGGGKEQIKTMHAAAVHFLPTERKLKWVHAEGEYGDSLAKSVGLDKSNFPDVALWEFGETEEDDKVFQLSKQEGGSNINKETIDALIGNWKTGGLSAEKDHVIALTSETFEEIVIASDRDVFVEFYAPWCGHCQALAPAYKQLAHHYAKDQSISIAKVDSTKHSHSSAEVKSYPTLKFYLQGKKSKPLDVEFKGGRDKQSMVDFIEKHRTGSKTSKAGKKDKKDKASKKHAKAQATDKPQLAAKAPADTAGGVWAFDDATDPTSRGRSLSAAMRDSEEGYTLVRAGTVGILISPDGKTHRSVRHFVSDAEAKRHAKENKEMSGEAAAAPVASTSESRSFACPSNADMYTCAAWCEGISTAANPLKGTLGGKACRDLPPGSKPQDMPQCMCYDADFTEVYGMCRSTCDVAQTSTGKGGAKKDKPLAADTCAAGEPGCAADVPTADLPSGSATNNATARYFLYDVKYGEGFNLQREVYPRAGWIVASLNKELEKMCGKKTDGPNCVRWKLVLPPWCRVVHWWTDSKHMPWGTFFDMKALTSSKVPLVEFSEYAKATGGQNVDLVVTYGVDDDEIAKNVRLNGGQGEFKGWAPATSDCAGRREHPKPTKDERTGEMEFIYAGHCDGGIKSRNFKCGKINGPWPKGVVDMLHSLDGSVGSVLVKGYDYLLSPDNSELDELGLRESMLFSPKLRAMGDKYIESTLKGQPYLAAHCRRTDFLRARAKSTPSAESIADHLNDLLQKHGLKQVFVATDATTDLRDDLQQRVRGEVHFYEVADGGESLDLPGQQAAVEKWIASRADFFIGSIESRFTMWIQLERGFLGKSRESSEVEFCKDFSETKKKPCIAPSYRHPARKGAHREKYIK
jgi:protein disulfide-isomerase A1